MLAQSPIGSGAAPGAFGPRPRVLLASPATGTFLDSKDVDIDWRFRPQP